MDILIRITLEEMRERGVLDAYYKTFNLDGASPTTMSVTLTQAQAEKIGLKMVLPMEEGAAKRKPRKAKQ